MVVIRAWRFQAGAGRTQPARSNASERPYVEDIIDDHDGDDGDGDDDDPLDGNPVWLIATVGLSEHVINRITVVRYKGGEGLVDGTWCLVCLCEFRDGESLRVLPKCDHAFHIECIDTWLRSHTNCPLCRSAIVLNPRRPSLGSNIDQSFGHSRRSELMMVGNAEMTGDVELGNDLVGSSGVDVNDSFSEGRGIDSSGALSKNKLDSRRLGYREDELYAVRRCISMDHGRRSRVVPFCQESMCSSNGIEGSSISLNSVHPHCTLTQYDNSSMYRLEEGSSLARSLHMSRAPVNRSSSWSGRVSFSKHGLASKPGC